MHYKKYSSGDPIVDLAYARTSGSCPIYQQNNIVGAEAESELYAYDTLHRLTNVKRGELSFPDNVPTVASPAREQTWTLDTLGNWQAPSGLAIDSNDNGDPGVPSEVRTHTVANQIDTITPESGTQFSVTHDPAGNVTILPDRSNPTTTADRFTYDCRNRLVSVEHTTTYDRGTPTWNVVVQYYYDAFNRLAKKHLPSQSANDIIYQYDGWRPARLLKKTGGNWLLWMRCIYGPQYIDQPLLIDKDTDGDGTVTEAGGSIRYFLCQQANYNVVAVTEDDGDVVETVKYDSYGQPTVNLQPGQTASENALLFQGQLWDSDAGLYCFRNRWYSPTLGRFLQRDPVGYRNGMNLYEMVQSNPIWLRDPLGKASGSLVQTILEGIYSLVFGEPEVGWCCTSWTPAYELTHKGDFRQCVLAALPDRFHEEFEEWWQSNSSAFEETMDFIAEEAIGLPLEHKVYEEAGQALQESTAQKAHHYHSSEGGLTQASNKNLRKGNMEKGFEQLDKAITQHQKGSACRIISKAAPKMAEALGAAGLYSPLRSLTGSAAILLAAKACMQEYCSGGYKAQQEGECCCPKGGILIDSNNGPRP